MLDEYKAKSDRGEVEVVEAGEYATDFGTQLFYVSKRSVLNLIRNPETSVMQVKFKAYTEKLEYDKDILEKCFGGTLDMVKIRRLSTRVTFFLRF